MTTLTSRLRQSLKPLHRRSVRFAAGAASRQRQHQKQRRHRIATDCPPCAAGTDATRRLPAPPPALPAVPGLPAVPTLPAVPASEPEPEPEPELEPEPEPEECGTLLPGLRLDQFAQWWESTLSAGPPPPVELSRFPLAGDVEKEATVRASYGAAPSTPIRPTQLLCTRTDCAQPFLGSRSAAQPCCWPAAAAGRDCLSLRAGPCLPLGTNIFLVSLHAGCETPSNRNVLTPTRDG